jgi:hypothetical protein
MLLVAFSDTPKAISMSTSRRVRSGVSGSGRRSYANRRPIVAPIWAIPLAVTKRSRRAINESWSVTGMANVDNDLVSS